MSLRYTDPPNKYFSRIEGLLYTHLSPVLIPAPNIKQVPSRSQTLIFIDADFRDGSKLEAAQTLAPDLSGFEVMRYSYEYERDSGFFFQFELEDRLRHSAYIDSEGEPQGWIRKSKSHLHVGARASVAKMTPDFPVNLTEHYGPHYRTEPLTIEYALAFIIVNFFPSEIAILEKLDISKYTN